MNIFENLENLNVSEECFNDIIDIVEEIIDEASIGALGDAADNSNTEEKRWTDAAEKAHRKLGGGPFNSHDPGVRAVIDDDEKLQDIRHLKDLDLPSGLKPSGHHPANKIFNAAYSSRPGRIAAVKNAVKGSPEEKVANKRLQRAEEIIDADPVLSRRRKNA